MTSTELSNPRRHRGERAGLNREAILEAALAHADRSGPDGLSVRALAAELSVDPMAIHYWFHGREALLDAAADLALANLGQPPTTGTWDDALRVGFASLWTTLEAHPGLGWTSRRLEACAPLAEFRKAVGNRLRDEGLPDRDAANACQAMLDLAMALAVAAARPSSGSSSPTPASRFRSGLGLLLDGLRLRVLDRKVAAGEL